jgi:DNA-binding MarR family transcriptional regulator
MAGTSQSAAPSAASERLENTLGALAVAISDRLLGGLRRGYELAPSDAAALVVLARIPQPIEAVRRQVGLSHSATVRLVDRLEAAGLAARVPGRDARTVNVRLTATGTREVRRLLEERERIMSDVLADLSTDERLVLATVVERLLEQLATDWRVAMHICRLCDIPGCEADGPCPVAVGAETRTPLAAETVQRGRRGWRQKGDDDQPVART